jgi:hypothetical protein
MKQRKDTVTGQEFWELEKGDTIRLPIYPAKKGPDGSVAVGGVYLSVQRLNLALVVRAMPGGIRITPLDSMGILVSTNHEDLKDL